MGEIVARINEQPLHVFKQEITDLLKVKGKAEFTGEIKRLST